MRKIIIILAMFCVAGFAQNSLTDSRDAKTYKTVQIGSQIWMAENLNFEAIDSKCYNDNPVNCGTYGRLYNWETAQTVCPAGSHLPSDAEWRELVTLTGTSWKLRAKTGWNTAKMDEQNMANNINGTDDYSFAAVPAGAYTANGFIRAIDFAYWHTSTEINAETARIYYMGSTDGTVPTQDVSKKNIYASVRCLINPVIAAPAPVVVPVAEPAPVVEPPPTVAAVPEPAPMVETPPAVVRAPVEAPVIAAVPELFVPEAANPPQSIPANIESNPVSSESKGGILKPAVSIGLGVVGLGAIAYGILQDKEVAKFVDQRKVSDAEDAQSKRNIGYIAGGVALASGITFYLFF